MRPDKRCVTPLRNIGLNISRARNNQSLLDERAGDYTSSGQSAGPSVIPATPEALATERQRLFKRREGPVRSHWENAVDGAGNSLRR